MLVVCTANVCRSPVAERMLQRRFDERGSDIAVTSAGTHGGRNRVHEDTVRAARELDVDLRHHESRLLTADLIRTDGADLIITMTREHLRSVVGIDPGAWPRSFTLKELARRGLNVPVSVDDLGEWVRLAGDGRRAADMMNPSSDDDLDDPYGGPYQGHVQMVHEVDALVGRIAQLLPTA